MLIDRPGPLRRVREAFSVHPVVILTGPRQCGKTTLARRIAAEAPQSVLFDLEAAADRRRLEAPEWTLGRLEGLAVIDEAQRRPALFETIRVLADRPRSRARFLLLGSASPALVRGVSESLAGRAGLVDLGGFDLGDAAYELDDGISALPAGRIFALTKALGAGVGGQKKRMAGRGGNRWKPWRYGWHPHGRGGDGEPGRDRTFDTLIKSQVLYRLSYGPMTPEIRPARRSRSMLRRRRRAGGPR